MSDCTHTRNKKSGLTASGTQRVRCLDCGKRFTESTSQLDGMRIGTDKAALIIQCLSEGMGVRGTARMTGAGKGTILNTLALVGERCKRYAEDAIVGVPVQDVQADEIWSFVFCKEKTRKKLSLPAAHFGSQYCYVGMERHNKLVLAWELGTREYGTGEVFVQKLAHACHKADYQFSTDGWQPYKKLVRNYLGTVDYGQIIKLFTTTNDDGSRYSPGSIVEVKRKLIQGNPDESRVCTSHVERGNLTMRMGIRRFTRLTNGFSKKLANHEAALGLHFGLYNFVTSHGTLRTTPAVAAGVASQPWSIAELIDRTKDYSPPVIRKTAIEAIIDEVTDEE